MTAGILLALAVVFLAASPAAAQESPAVSIDFEVGDFDPAKGDWPITAVRVRGELEEDTDFTVVLWDADGDVLWSGSDAYAPPETTVAVGTFVAVGDVEEAGVAQQVPDSEEPTPAAGPVAPVVIVDPEVAGDVVRNPSQPGGPDGAVDPTDPTTPLGPDEPTPDVEGEVVTRPDVQLPQQGSGLGGAGQLALSMVIAVVFVAILFRTPLPSATTQRWRR